MIDSMWRGGASAEFAKRARPTVEITANVRRTVIERVVTFSLQKNCNNAAGRHGEVLTSVWPVRAQNPLPCTQGRGQGEGTASRDYGAVCSSMRSSPHPSPLP